MPKEKIIEPLILGDGLLGAELFKQTGWPTVSRKKNGFDITKKDNWEELLIAPFKDKAGPDIIVNCIGHTDTYSEEKEKHWAVNYAGLVDLVDFCNELNIKLVHISTDFVYYNSKSESSEEDVPATAPNWYSYTKLLSDAYVQLKLKDYLLIRCSHKKNPFEFESGYVNYIGNFDYVERIGDLIIKLINKEATGVYNVGSELKTMYDLGIRTKAKTNISIGNINNLRGYVDISMCTKKLKQFLNEGGNKKMNKNISLEEFKDLFGEAFRFDKDNYTSICDGRRDEDGIIRDKTFRGAKINTASSLIAVADVLGSKTILEIGTWRGYTSTAVGKFLEKKYSNAKEIVVDTLDIKVGGYDGGQLSPKNNLVKTHFWMPHHTVYDDWKYTDRSIVHKDFIDLRNEVIYLKNLDFLNSIKPPGGYDLVFIDGDHSFKGAGFDYRYATEVINELGVIVFDDRQGHASVGKLFDSIQDVEKWDFLEVNQEHFETQSVLHNFGIVFKRG